MNEPEKPAGDQPDLSSDELGDLEEMVAEMAAERQKESQSEEQQQDESEPVAEIEGA